MHVFDPGVLSRAAAMYCESFVFSVGVGDDFAMRTSIETIESLRTQLFDALQNCRLPKVSSYQGYCQYLEQ